METATSLFLPRILLGGTVVLLLAVSHGNAGPPANDHFADRIVLSGARITVSGSNVEATVEPAEADQGSVDQLPVRKSVWWTWTAPAVGGLVASAIESDFAAVVEVRSGSTLSNLVTVPGGISGSPASGRQPAAMRVEAGVAYHIKVGSWDGTSGRIVLDLAFVPQALNDDFVNRVHLETGNIRAAGSMLGASTEADEPFPLERTGGGSLWWSWTAGKTESVTFQVAALAPSPAEQAFAGRLPAFPNSASLHMGVCTGDSLAQLVMVTNRSVGHWISPPLNQAVVEVRAGTTYHVWVAGEPGYLENIELVIARGEPPDTILTMPRPESGFDDESPVAVAAEAQDADGSVGTVEFFVAGYSQRVVERNVRSLRPFRGVFTNLPPTRYGLIARATDAAGLKSDAIPVEFDVRPANDAFANRKSLNGATGSVSGVLGNASREADEPPALMLPTVWWTWTAPAAGRFTFTTSSRFDGIAVDVFVGESLATLTAVPALFRTWNRFVLQAERGVEYAIALSGDPIGYTLNVVQTEPPAITLLSPTNGMQVVEGGTVIFAAEAVDPDGDIRRVEFFSDYDSSLGVVSHAPYAMPKTLPVGDYSIYAVATDSAGVSTRSGEVALRIFPAPPANDAFANRISFTGSFVTVTGNTANATIEGGEVDLRGVGSAWWEWTAPETAAFTISAASEVAYWPGLAVHTGGQLATLTMITNAAFDGSDDSYSTLVTIQAVAGQRYPISCGSQSLVRLGVARTTPPAVHIASPVNDTVHLVGEALEIRAEAFDADGTVERVEFFVNSLLYASVTNAPFVIAVPFTNEGYYRLHARAVDNNGIINRSEEVRFLVLNPGPPNDHFTNRIPFTGSFVSVTGTTANATLESGEGGWLTGGSAWWEWAAPDSGTFTITATSLPGYWPSIALLSGESWETLSLIANAAYRGDLPEYVTRVVFEAEAGMTYPIAVASRETVVISIARTQPPSVNLTLPAPGSGFRAGDMVTFQADASDGDGFVQSVEFFLDGRPFATVTNAPFVVHTDQLEAYWFHTLVARAKDNHGVSTYSGPVRFEVAPRRPVNDDFADRTALQGWFVAVTGNMDGATREPDEPSSPPREGSVWWSWRAPASGRVTVACDQFDAMIAVFQGTNLAQLELLAGRSLQLEFNATAGNEYSILVQSSLSGTFRLALVLDARELRGPRLTPDGRIGFELYTTFERNWRLERTTNFPNWIPLPTGQPAEGRLEFVDPEILSDSQRFYRAVAEE